jgi:hypothetical protein
MRQSAGRFLGLSMFVRVLFALWAIFVTAPGLSAAELCPAGDAEEIEKLLAEAPSCDRSMDLFKVCSYGAGGDTGLGTIVTEKCEGDFLAKLSRAERRAYNRRIRACDRKYARESGTMYRSFEAFCRASVAQRYARRAARGRPARR